MKTFKMTIKYNEDILDYEWGFEAKTQKEADSRAVKYNRYHSKQDEPGWGYAIAKETSGNIIIRNNWA